MLARVRRALLGAERAFSALVVVVILAVVCVQVVSRYVLRSPTVGTDEAARYGLVWVTFVGAAAVMAVRGHVAVDFIATLLPSGLARWMTRLADIIVVIVCATMFFAGIAPTLQRVGRTSTTLGLPAEVLFVGVLAGLALMTVHAVVNLLETWNQPREPSPPMGEVEQIT